MSKQNQCLLYTAPESSVVSILETTAADGKNYQTRYYNLDAIIAHQPHQPPRASGLLI